jgi:hypothetical protein
LVPDNYIPPGDPSLSTFEKALCNSCRRSYPLTTRFPRNPSWDEFQLFLEELALYHVDALEAVLVATEIRNKVLDLLQVSKELLS